MCQCVVHSHTHVHNEDDCVARHSPADVTCIQTFAVFTKRGGGIPGPCIHTYIDDRL